MIAKQLGVSVDEGAEIYNQFVDNIKNGRIPQDMKDFAQIYSMSKMIDEELGINLENRAEIEATTWLLVSESYKNIQKTILDVAQGKDITMSPSERMNIRKHLDWAKAATIEHQGDDYSGNMVATVDQGLYGATQETGFAVKFRNNHDDTISYEKVVNNALNSGNNGGRGY